MAALYVLVRGISLYVARVLSLYVDVCKFVHVHVVQQFRQSLYVYISLYKNSTKCFKAMWHAHLFEAFVRGANTNMVRQALIYDGYS